MHSLAIYDVRMVTVFYNLIKKGQNFVFFISLFIEMEKYRGAFNKNKLLVTYLVLEKHIFDKNIYAQYFWKKTWKKLFYAQNKKMVGKGLLFDVIFQNLDPHKNYEKAPLFWRIFVQRNQRITVNW